jgi:hypothetical protein
MGWLIFLSIVIIIVNIFSIELFSDILVKNGNFKPYIGIFRVKHLLLIFLLPAYIFILMAFLLGLVIIFMIEHSGKYSIKKFLNKPLFSKEEEGNV